MENAREHDAYLQKIAEAHYYGDQDENGIDLSLLKRNLTLTVHERLVRSSRARKNMLRLRDIGRQNRQNGT